MKYRAEIDGLRALAVVPVILFHAGFELFSGGFVGVDVFFVISGYLITTILIEDIENGRFSIVNFYERRARRILPVLFFVMLVCIPFAWMWMLPSQMKDFSQSLVAVSLFASNILFWRESGYFSAVAEEKPLLHTWSLAVEEQYYLIFPIFLILFWRFGKNRVFWMIVVLAAISLVLSEWGWRNKPTANFYLAPTRAWELFSGSIAAFITSWKGVRKNNYLATLGIVAIVFSIFFYDETIPFPSMYALVPVLGVVLLILYADKETFAARLLGTKGFIGIGLISYSAYLWHQPLFAFAKISSSNTLSILVYFYLTVLSFLLAYLSWRFIENPFRRRYASKVKVFTLSGIFLILNLILGLAGHFFDGVSERYSVKELALVSPQVGDSSGCHNGLNAEQIVGGIRCIITKNDENAVETAVVGDSHASVITDALKYSMGNIGQGFYAFNGSWCAPLMHFATNAKGKNGCLDENNSAYYQILNDDTINNVILVAEWANYDWGYRWNDATEASYLFRENGSFDFSNANVENNLAEFSDAVRYTFQKLSEHHKNVIIVLSVPEFDFDVPTSFNPRAPFVNSQLLQLSMADYLKRTSRVSEVLQEYGNKFGYKIVSPASIMCDGNVCFPSDERGTFYVDGNHLSFLGASLITPSIVEFLTDGQKIQ